ncbi:MAG TPA: presenilin family intramembrane aspartyl protease PSH [Thermoplasmata archaeon]|jgi:presenilin-like A22 family membrane protease
MDASVRTSVVMGIIFAVSQLGALFMAWAFLGPEWQVFEDPNDPLIPLYYIAAVVLFTLVILYIIKKKREDLVRIIFLGAVTYTIFFVILMMAAGVVGGVIPFIASVAVTAVIAYYLVKKPEWYVIDAAGILMSIGIIGMFGISLGILPVLILLIILAIYDAVSVYGTKHMVALADGVTKMRLPILLVIPKKRGYSYLTQKPLMQQLDEGGEREAMFMGLGDVIIPGILITSAFYFLPDDALWGMTANLAIALGTLVGAMIGFTILMRFVLKGNPQAGLPLLNGGAIAGYIVTYLVAFREFSFGIALPW